VDAPGLVTASSGLNHFLMEEAQDIVSKSDVLLAVLNIDERNLDNLKSVIEIARTSGKPWIAIIHKTDLPQLHRPEILKDELKKIGVRVIGGSSVKSSAEFQAQIIEELLPLLPEADGPIYDKELFTPASERDLCAEIIREKCFETLHQEIPFGTAVRILSFTEKEGEVPRIHAEILVSKPNHLSIVVGREARVIKQIGVDARKDIEKLLQRKVYLHLEVLAAKNWYKNPKMMKDLGYELRK
jgi:GTPase